MIAPESPPRVPDIRRVLESAFETPSEADLVDALRVHGGIVVSLVAVVEREVVGHIAFSRVTVSGDASAPGVALAPLAVQPTHQRRGLGAGLVSRGLEMCAALGYAFVVVLGDPTYYGRFGFVPAAEFGLRDEFGGRDYFMALELRRGALAATSGLVRYAPAFDRFKLATAL